MRHVRIDLPTRRFVTSFEREDILTRIQASIASAEPGRFPEGEQLLNLLLQEGLAHLKLAYKQEGRFVRLAASLLEEGKGKVFCLQCDTWYNAATIVCQHVRYGDGGALGGGEGRVWHCPHGHRVFEVYDSRA